MGKKLAFFTFGQLIQPFGHQAVQGFIDRIAGVYEAADAMEGFIGRSERNMETMTHSWGKIETPQCWGVEDLERTVATLSLWADIESVAAFAYHGAHGEAMTKRNEWFQHRGLPEHTAWWVDSQSQIDWQTAAKRMDHLFENGPTPLAFSLKSPFDEGGQPYKLVTSKVREKAGIA